jgi:hypothetical protein
MVFWLWLRRGIFLIWGFGIAMVRWMITRGIITLAAWFIWTPLTSGSLTLWVFLVLIGGRGVALCMTIRWADIVDGWMLVIGGYFVICSYCLRLPLSRVWRVSLVG